MASSSSDEEVYWGPYTLKEAKRDIKKYRPKKPSARFTIGPLLSDMSDTSTNVDKLPDDVKGLSLSPNLSTYVTPRNSTSNNSNNSDFLKEVSQAITAPSPACSYYTAIDQSNLLENTFLKNVASNLTCDLASTRPISSGHSPITDAKDKVACSLISSQTMTSIRSPVNDVNSTYFCQIATKSPCYLDNVEHTLVENTIILSDEEPEQNDPYNSLNMSKDSLSFISVKKENTSDNQPIYIEDDIIEISEDNLSLDSMEEEIEALQSDQTSRDNSGCLLIDLDNENQDDDVEEPLHKSLVCDTDEEVHKDSDQESGDYPPNMSRGGESREACYEDKENMERSEARKVDKDHRVSNQESNQYSFNLSEGERQHKAYQEDIENHLESSGVCEVDKHHRVSNQESNHYSSNLSESERQHEACQEDIENHLESSVSRNDNTGMVSYTKRSPEQQYYSYSSAQSSIAECHLKDYTDNTRNSVESGINSLKSITSNVDTTDELPKINVEFDDTLEDMNRFLDQISSDSSPESNRDSNLLIPTKTVDRTPQKTAATAIPAFRSENKLKPAPSREPFNSAGHKQKYFDFDQRPTPPTIQRKNLFKLPPTPVKFKTTNQFKNIQSPVGIYIKNSPRYMPMIKVHNKEISELPFPKSNIPVHKSKENLAPNASALELKPVLYKPSSTRSVTAIKDVNLPASIRKLCPEPTVTRHHQKQTCQTLDVVRRLIEIDKDLSILDSERDSNDDISILTIKQAFIK